MRRRWPQLLSTAAVLLLALAVVLLNNRGAGEAQPTAAPPAGTAIAAATATTQAVPPRASGTIPAASQPPAATRTPTPRGQPPTPTPDGKLPTIAYNQLPGEAQETIRLIDQGGPFPYDRDGITFGNRERLLPLRADGYYREYTVITPGSSDRGARRIIAGQAGELYYTDDHYESFRRVIR